MFTFSFGPLEHSASTQWIKEISGPRTTGGILWDSDSICKKPWAHSFNVRGTPTISSTVLHTGMVLHTSCVTRKTHSHMPTCTSQIGQWHTRSQPCTLLTGHKSACLSLTRVPTWLPPVTHFPFLGLSSTLGLHNHWDQPLPWSGNWHCNFRKTLQINTFCEMWLCEMID